MANDNEPVSANELSPTPAKRSKKIKVAKVAKEAVRVAKVLWGIPFIKSIVGTRLAQAGIVGAVAAAVADKALGG